MPKFETAADVLAFRGSLSTVYTRIPQYREVIDRKMSALAALKSVMADDYQKAFTPYQTGAPAKSLYRLTNIMASNQSEIAFKARSTDPTVISRVQKHEHGHEALDPQLFPIAVRRRMYSFLADGYTIVALDVTPKPGALADFANTEELEAAAEAATEIDESDDTPQGRYTRAYAQAKGKTPRERHENAYNAVTTDALIADGAGLRVRVVDPLTFKGFQTDEDPSRFAEGMEFGRKQLNPLLSVLDGYGVRVDNGILYIDKGGGERVYTMSYRALGVGMIAESQGVTAAPSGWTKGEQYVEYTQVRTCEETVIVIENPGGAVSPDGERGILIRVPNLFGGQSTGYYLIEGDAKLRSGDLEERYDPPLLELLNEAQHYNITRTSWEAMGLAEATRSIYQLAENPAAQAIEPHDPTQETKSAQPDDGAPVPIAAGEVKRVEGFGQKLEALLTHATEMLHEAQPTDIWGGTGSSSETGIAIARRQTALLTELTPYQANVATVCKLIHQDVDRYVVSTGESIKLAYLPEGADKPEVRQIVPETARLPMDMDYTIGADTPESKYAAEQMSERRMQLKIIGKLDHMEEIGIKDPLATEQRQIEDEIMVGVTGVVANAATEALAAYAKAAVERELGPLPQPPSAPPQLVGPNGEPLPPSGAMGGGGPGIPPPAFGPAAPPPTQTVPSAPPNRVPVTPGGPGATV